MVADGLFVVVDDEDDAGLVVGFRVGLFVVVLPVDGLFVTVEGVVEFSTVPFRV